MWNEPTPEELASIPRLYETEKISESNKIIHVHFFIGACDWYVAEFDGEDVFFGFANLGDPLNAEWGYFSLSVMKAVRINGMEIDRDLFWRTKRFLEIKSI